MVGISRKKPEAATAVVTVQVETQHIAAFSEWQRGMNAAVSKSDGFVSTDVIEPQTPGEDDFVVIYRFASAAALKSWIDSPERQVQLKLRPPGILGEGESMNVVIGKTESDTSQPVTAVITVQVSPTDTEVYEEWQGRMSELMAKQPGHLGTTVQEPISGLQDEWVIITRFDNEEHLARWMQSKPRAKMLAEIGPIIARSSVKRTRTSFDGWFRFNDGDQPPRAWQQSALVLLVLFPTVVAEILFVEPFLNGLNLAVSTFIGNVISVAITGFVLIPIAAFVFRWWIKPNISKVRLWTGALIVLFLYVALITFLAGLVTRVHFVPWFVL